MKWTKKNFGTLAERQEKIPGALYDIENYNNLSVKLPRIQNLSAVAEILTEKLVENNIYIVGDYDCDGIMSMGIMLRVLRYLAGEAERISKKKASVIKIIVPDREKTGYGFAVSHAENIRNSTFLLLDNGIVQYEAIDKAKENGNSVIIVDHHEPGDHLPNADIIVNPHAIEGGQYDNYCAAGLSYRLAREMLTDEWVFDSCDHDAICDYMNEFLFMAAIATVADVVPLLWENRIIVREGMKYIPPRWDEICSCLLDTKKDFLNEGDVAYKIAPAINAVGRLGELDEDFVESLITDEDVSSIAARIQYMNVQRKELTKKHLRSLEIKNPDDKVIVLHDNSIPAGITGILAGNLADRYKKPVFVFGAENDNMITGSARAEKGLVHIKNLLDRVDKEVPGLLKKYGGHEAAAGVTIESARIDEFSTVINSLAEYTPITERYYDFDIDAEDNWFDIYDGLAKYAPYGEGNPAPILHFHANVNERCVKIMAKDHIKIQSGLYEAVGFYMARKANLNVHEYDLYGSLQMNEYMGSCRIQMNIEDLEQPAESHAETKVSDFARALAACI